MKAFYVEALETKVASHQLIVYAENEDEATDITPASKFRTMVATNC